MNPINSKKNITTEVPEIQYKITWDFIDPSNSVHRDISETFEDRDIANETWIFLKKNKNFTNIRTEIINNQRKYFAVEVIYFNYPKIYTFLSKQKVTSDYVVVGTNGILQVVKVVKSYETTRKELEKKMNFSKYLYISGIVTKE